MKKIFSLTATLILIFGMAWSAQAALVTITFDEEGIDFGERITDQYADYGIHWDAAYSNLVTSGADFNNAFTCDGQILQYDTKPANGTILLDTATEYMSFEFRRPSAAGSFNLAIYDASSGTDVLVWDFGSIGWSGDDWLTFTYDGLFGSFDKIVMYAEKKFIIDNFTVDTAAAVPIPPSVLLLGTGLISLVFRRKRS
ncbi:MAG: PEP-CTERM sorting domain-containing protein [Spirochaetaceae bacterium]|nr:PEP-CTERM sorting domain-containing protein [Spirochaetaceae bacterium]